MVLAEVLDEDVGERRPRQVKRGVKRKQSKYPARKRAEKSQKHARATVEILS